MSQVKYTIEGSVGDGALISAEMSPAYERGYISVIFYSDNFITPVTPSAGTLTFAASETGVQYGTVFNGVVDATVAEYNRPTFAGTVTNVRATALGILGAVNYRASINRFS